jgi:dienelactone hydrolase
MTHLRRRAMLRLTRQLGRRLTAEKRVKSHTSLKISAIFSLFMLLPGLACAQQRVVIPETGGVDLPAKLFLPAGPATAPGVVALHGCGGPLARRDDGWAKILAGQGHPVLLPDSFAARGLKPDCKDSTHGTSAYGARRADALAAAAWLQAQTYTPAGGVILLGWSDGGTTVLASIGPGMPARLIRGAVAFYPACTRTVKRADWRNAVPLLILMGAADDWTPPAPCRALAARDPGITIDLFAGAYHDFDVPDDPVHEIDGLPYTRYGNGVAHAGQNAAARAQALKIVPAFLRVLPPAAQ